VEDLSAPRVEKPEGYNPAGGKERGDLGKWGENEMADHTDRRGGGSSGRSRCFG